MNSMTREMKDSGSEWIGQIPQHWIALPNKYLMKKLKMILSRYNDEPILSLTMDGVIVRDLDAGGKMPTSFDGYQKISKGNLLMCLFDIDVTPRCIGLIKQDGVTSPAYSQFVLNAGNYAPYYYYLYLYLDNDKLLLPLAKNLRHSLTEDVLGEIPMIQPPLSEQQSIANYLDFKCSQIDQLSDNIKQQIEELGEYKKALITQAVTKGLDPDVEMKDSGIAWVGNMPKEWNVVPAKYLIEIKKRIAGQEGPTVLSITQSGIKPKDITSGDGQLAESYANYQLIYPGEFGMNHMDLLTGWIDLSEYSGVVSPDYRVFTTRSESVDKRYLLYLFQMCYKSRIFYGLGQGAAQMGRWRLPATNMMNMKLPVPPLCIQRRISEYLDRKTKEIDLNVKNMQLRISELTAYKKSLIFEYVTGKREVPASYRKDSCHE